MIPLSGTVTFTPSITHVQNVNASPNPVTISLAPIVGVLDEEGYLCTPVSLTDRTPMYRGVRLIATDDTDLSVKNWHYTVAYRFGMVNSATPSIPAHALAVPLGAEGDLPIDLSKFAPVPSSPPIGTPQALALLAKAEEAATLSATNSAAALQVVARADAGEFTGDPGPAGLDGSNVLPTNAAILQTLQTDEAVKSELSATIGESVAPLERLVYIPQALAPAVASRLAAWGDSLTESGDDATSYVAYLADLLGMDFYNGGWWGQSARAIAARQGGWPAKIKPTSGTIPASGSVACNIPYPNLLTASHHGSRPGILAGVPGVLTYDGTALTFSRDTAGAAVAVPSAVRFTPTDGMGERSSIQIIWAGRNGAAFVDEALDSIASMVHYSNPRFLVLEILPWVGSTDDEKPLNLALRDLYPESFVPVAQWLRSQAAADAVGITFSAQDNTDIASGHTPSSFRTDGVHLNEIGRQAVASLLESEIVKRGWTDSAITRPAMSTTPDHWWSFSGLLPGTSVSRLADKAGSLALLQATPASQPITVKDSALKGRVADVNPDGVTANLSSTPAAFTAHFVGRLTSSATANNQFIIGIGGVYLRSSGAYQWGAYSAGGNIGSTVAVDDAAHVLTLVSNGATSTVWLDGVKIGTGTTVISGAQVLLGLPTTSTPARAAELVVWKSAKADADIAADALKLKAAYIA